MVKGLIAKLCCICFVVFMLLQQIQIICHEQQIPEWRLIPGGRVMDDFQNEPETGDIL